MAGKDLGGGGHSTNFFTLQSFGFEWWKLQRWVLTLDGSQQIEKQQ